VLCVALSSKLSMGYSTAHQAAALVRDKFPDRLVEVLDSRQAIILHCFTVFRSPCRSLRRRGRKAAVRSDAGSSGDQATRRLCRHAGNAGIPGARRSHRQGRLYAGKPDPDQTHPHPQWWGSDAAE